MPEYEFASERVLTYVTHGCSKAYTILFAEFIRLLFRVVVVYVGGAVFFLLLCLHNGTRIITHFYYFYGPMKRSMLHIATTTHAERESKKEKTIELANKIDVHVNA